MKKNSLQVMTGILFCSIFSCKDREYKSEEAKYPQNIYYTQPQSSTDTFSLSADTFALNTNTFALSTDTSALSSDQKNTFLPDNNFNHVESQLEDIMDTDMLSSNNTPSNQEIINLEKPKEYFELKKHKSIEKEMDINILLLRAKEDINLMKVEEFLDWKTKSEFEVQKEVTKLMNEYKFGNYKVEINSSNANYRNNNSSFGAGTNGNVIQVDGYTKSKGTHVEPYLRTEKNNTVIDNFSHYGNFNPNTGKAGTKRN